MTTGNENVNDVNSAVQTQESQMGEGELQVDTSKVDAGSKSDGQPPLLVAKNMEKNSTPDKSSKSIHRFIKQL